MKNSILYAEVNLVCSLFLLLLGTKVRKSMYLQEQRKILLLVILFNIFLYAADSIWIFVDNNILGITRTINWLLNGVFYILGGLLGYLWFRYSETVQKSKFVTEKKYRILSAVPIIILVVVVLLSYKTGWMFYIDAANTYHRGPLYFLQILIVYGYLLVTGLKSLFLSFQKKEYDQKTDFRILSTFIIPTLISGFTQILYPGLPILCVGNTFGILYIYLNFQERLVSVDALTKLNNRNQLFQYLSLKFLHPNKEKELYLLLMDIDYFKLINDQHGHLEGDNALRLFADCLKRVAAKGHHFICRYGGDEFMLICELTPRENVQDICKAVYAEVGKIDVPYKFSVSIGYAKYEPEMKKQEALIEKADEELYKIKKGRK